MNLLITILLIHTATAAEITFNPVSTQEARALREHQFAFGKSPVGNMNSSFLVNSLSYSPAEHFEFGISPLYFFVPHHRLNGVMRVNIGQTDMMNWLGSVGFVRFSDRGAELLMTSYGVTNNIRIANLWNLGLFLGVACISLMENGITHFYSCKGETGIDLQYQASDQIWITAGHGSQREKGLTTYEKIISSFGLSVAINRPGKFFSRPSFGVNFSEEGKLTFNVNSQFY